MINTSCPRAFAEGIWWNKASFGRVAEEDCPFGSSGELLILNFCFASISPRRSQINFSTNKVPFVSVFSCPGLGEKCSRHFLNQSTADAYPKKFPSLGPR